MHDLPWLTDARTTLDRLTRGTLDVAQLIRADAREDALSIREWGETFGDWLVRATASDETFSRARF